MVISWTHATPAVPKLSLFDGPNAHVMLMAPLEQKCLAYQWSQVERKNSSKVDQCKQPIDFRWIWWMPPFNWLESYRVFVHFFMILAVVVFNSISFWWCATVQWLVLYRHHIAHMSDVVKWGIVRYLLGNLDSADSISCIKHAFKLKHVTLQYPLVSIADSYPCRPETPKWRKWFWSTCTSTWAS